MNDIDQINHDVLQVFRDENLRARQHADRLRDDWARESREHGKTERRLRRAVALAVLACKNISNAGKRSKMLPVYVAEFLNFFIPTRDPRVMKITKADVEWAEQMLSHIKSNFDKPEVPCGIDHQAIDGGDPGGSASGTA